MAFRISDLCKDGLHFECDSDLCECDCHDELDEDDDIGLDHPGNPNNYGHD